MRQKIKYISLVVFIFLSIDAKTQVYFGLKANYALSFNRSAEIKYDDRFDFLDYKVKFLDQDISPTITAFVFYTKDIIFLQAELGYRTVKTRFSFIDFRTADNLMPQFDNKVKRSIMIPVMAGVSVDRFKFGLGPVLSFVINENQIFQSFEMFEERSRSFNGGFRIGASMQLYHLYFDLSFEQRFNGVAESFYYRGDNKGFSEQSQLINFGLGYLF